MNQTSAEQFAHDWIASWNAHDLARVLSHYADDFEMSSPYIAQIAGESTGTLKGKTAIANYWQQALARMPNLHFELISVLTGVESVTLYYKSAGNRLAAEVFFFAANGKVAKAFAHYGV
jgi:SnoaL-like domain